MEYFSLSASRNGFQSGLTQSPLRTVAHDDSALSADACAFSGELRITVTGRLYLPLEPCNFSPMMRVARIVVPACRITWPSTAIGTTARRLGCVIHAG